MSISLKVVRLALVSCDFLRFLEIVYLILLIGTLISVLEPVILFGADPVTYFTAGGAYLGAVGVCAGAWTYCLGASACFGASAYLGRAAGVGEAY
jgi:hypothetical protein